MDHANPPPYQGGLNPNVSQPQPPGVHPSSQSYPAYQPGPYPSGYSAYPGYAPPYGYQGYQPYPGPPPPGLYAPGPGRPVYIIEERKEPSALAICLNACLATLCCCCVWDLLTFPQVP
nr:cysteine-rich and transmembrane domain-containing protein 1-like [Zootoca vivipara]